MKKIFLTAATLLLLAVGWSCQEKFLTVEPQDGSINDGSFFNTTQHFDEFIYGIYTELQNAADLIIIPGSMMQDLTSDNTAGNLPIYMLPANNVFHDKIWQPGYNMASRATIILNRLDGAPADTRDRIEAEAKFFRGYAYFNLARAFGTLPLLLDPYDPSQELITCTPEEQIWAQVVKDLSESVPKMPTRAQWGPINLGRASRGTALAYLANAYMYQKDWAKAAKASEDLIALGEFGLMPNVRDAFSIESENSKESIFEVQYRTDNNFDWSGNYNKGTLLPKLTGPDLGDNRYTPGGAWGNLTFSRRYATSFEPGDKRRRELIVTAGEKYKGESMADTLLMPPNQTGFFSTKYWRGAQIGPSDLLQPQNVPLMRYSEFLLNYAEILYELGRQTEAYTQLNLVRARAGLAAKPVSTNKETFMTALMNERRWELGMEPNPWYHFTRTGRAKDFLLTQYGLDFQDAWLRFPIPQRERNQNPNLCQNPGYVN